MKEEICNYELMKDTMEVLDEANQLIHGVLKHYSDYIADTIKEGSFETITVPYFGKFEPKTRQIQRRFNNKGKHYTWNSSKLEITTKSN